MSSDDDRPIIDDTIDADFEPAPATHVVEPEKERSSPGWLPVGLVGLLSVGALGASGLALSNQGIRDTYYAPATLVTDLDEALKGQADLERDLTKLKTSSAATEKRLQAEMKTVLSGDGQTEGLEALIAELDAVSKRLDDAPIGQAAADTEALEELETRLAALEEADDGEAVSPRQMNRAVTAMRERVKTLEASNEELTSKLATRDEALASLTKRLEDAEFALEEVRASGGAASSAVTESPLTALRSELDGLKTTIERNEEIDAENEERFAALLEGLNMSPGPEEEVDTARGAASAALALSRIEAAARDGRPFQTAWNQLSEAMPTDSSVLAIKPIAARGAPTLLQLKQRFEGDREAALDAAFDGKSDGWGWTRKVFGGGVKVRKAGEEGGPADLLDQAADALETGNISAAVSATGKLPDTSKAIMTDWLTDAKQRMLLESALDDLGVKMIGTDR